MSIPTPSDIERLLNQTQGGNHGTDIGHHNRCRIAWNGIEWWAWLTWAPFLKKSYIHISHKVPLVIVLPSGAREETKHTTTIHLRAPAYSDNQDDWKEVR